MPAHPLMWALAWTLRRAGWEPRIFVYPSWRRDIPANAARLAAWMQRWGVEELDVVTFSLGGIVLRWAAAHHDLPRLRRVVLLGPPNRGATMADWLDTRLGILFPAIWGRAARQLRRGDLGLCERAGAFPPGTEFAVIAGGRGSGKGLNPLIPGDNDFIVGVAETILPGMGDFTLVPHRHSLLPLSRRACRLTVRFLKDGRFRESPKKH
jgi:pimeloyl-ACP methyl ester carboxylesterase